MKGSKSWRDANNAEVCQMERDNIDIDGFTMMTDGDLVTVGRIRGDYVDVPRKTFNKLLEEYLKPRTLVPPADGE